jgi:hypothetical protein
MHVRRKCRNYQTNLDGTHYLESHAYLCYRNLSLPVRRDMHVSDVCTRISTSRYTNPPPLDDEDNTVGYGDLRGEIRQKILSFSFPRSRRQGALWSEFLHHTDTPPLSPRAPWRSPSLFVALNLPSLRPPCHSVYDANALAVCKPLQI